MMRNIDTTIADRVGVSQTYYLIGACQDDLETLDHEVAHGLYATSPTYNSDMKALVGAMPSSSYERVCGVLSEMGYHSSVHDDEIQANFSTGLTNHFRGFQRFCQPFVDCFTRHQTPRNMEPLYLECVV